MRCTSPGGKWSNHVSRFSLRKRSDLLWPFFLSLTKSLTSKSFMAPSLRIKFRAKLKITLLLVDHINEARFFQFRHDRVVDELLRLGRLGRRVGSEVQQRLHSLRRHIRNSLPCFRKGIIGFIQIVPIVGLRVLADDLFRLLGIRQGNLEPLYVTLEKAPRAIAILLDKVLRRG